MSIEERQSRAWAEPGDEIQCRVDGEVFDEEDFDSSVEITLYIDELVEKFNGRRVLSASAESIADDDVELSEEVRRAVMDPTYVIEESERLGEKSYESSGSLESLVRTPASVEAKDGIRRSVFVNNIGVCVGDLVDLVRGELNVEQVEVVFGAIAELFEALHDRGWVHLGLTPWNVRIFDESERQGFPRSFLAAAFDETSTNPEPSEPEERLTDDPTEASPLGDSESDNEEEADNEFASERERTVVELKPLGESGAKQSTSEPSDDADSGEGADTIEEKGVVDANEAADTEESEGDEDDAGEQISGTLYDSEVSWSEISGDTEPSVDRREEVRAHEELTAVLDGIDRLYPAGDIDEEVAVTPGFSAPELLSGIGSEDGESADVFSLGMFLYFLVSGVVPPASVYTRYAPAIPARNFRPAFPPGLQAVISRATRPQPEDRYASVSAMREAFEDACEVMRERASVTTETAPTLNLASDTHIGIAKRERNPTNQDSVFSASSDDGQMALVVVADGVSTASYGSGDLASNALTEEAEKVWEEVLPSYLMEESLDEVAILQRILRQANDRIVDHVNEHHTPFRGSPHEVMGSTALVALIVEGVVTLASLGDSRVYLQRGPGIEQITIDHNLWTLSILDGVDADSALAMPHGDALARCLGTFVVEDGQLEEVDPQPDLFRFRVVSGDTLLLTTDGLVDFAGTNLLASEDNILSVLLSEPDPALACLEFILLANRGGGGDNIGLSVARFE